MSTLQPARTQISFMLNDKSITMVLKGRAYNLAKEDEYFEQAVKMVKSGAKEEDLLNFIEKEVNRIKDALKVLDGTEVSIADGIVAYKGEPMHNTLTKKMLQMLEEGFDLGPMGKFMNNLMDNPSKRAIDELYGFLEKGELPITPDGHFLAYKAVRSDFKDRHSGTFDNSIGKVCSMPRNKVDDDKDRTCSNGLHFCSVEYLKSFAVQDGHVMVLKINPADVVSIPSDYNDTKGRCAKYTVVDEYKNFEYNNPDKRAWDQSVVDSYSVKGQNGDWDVTNTGGVYVMDSTP